MIWLLLTCSSFFAAGTPVVAVRGSVELRDSREAAVRKGSDYSGVVVSLDPVRKAAATSDAPRTHARMLQKGKIFRPHILPVEAGTVIDFPNDDPIFHNAFSSYSGQIFDIGLYAPGSTRSVRFTRPGIVRVFCNIHPAMSAVIVVLDTPWFAVTDRQGSFRIPAPPGDYVLHVYHERATEEHLKQLTRPVHVGEAGLDLPPIVVSESGFLFLPHRNKYGGEYPPATDDGSFYPGVRK